MNSNSIMISANDVKRLREMTGAGMMDCKKALEEADGNFDAAIDILRKKGQKVSAKRAEREANEGIIVTQRTDDARLGVVVEVNSETDFVARNSDFVTFAKAVADLAIKARPADIQALRALPMGHGTVEDVLSELVGKIGEKLDVRRFALLHGSEGIVVDYVHPGAKLGVLVSVSGAGDLVEAGRDVAMQVAAMNPVAARREDVPAEVREKEMEIAREVARNEGKPEPMVDRIATGKLERYYKDNVLLEQAFVKDSSVSVEKMLKARGVELLAFVRYALGG